MANFLGKLLTLGEGRQLKQFEDLVARINELESERRSSPTSFSGATPEYKQRVADGETLDDLLPEAFAAAREAAVRALGMRHFDVQLIGGMVAEPRHDRRDEDR